MQIWSISLRARLHIRWIRCTDGVQLTEQKVTVNNVSVSGGGQAIVGHVTHTGGSGTNDVANPPPTITDQSGTAMPIIQPDEQSATTVPRIEQDQEPAPMPQDAGGAHDRRS